MRLMANYMKNMRHFQSQLEPRKPQPRLAAWIIHVSEGCWRHHAFNPAANNTSKALIETRLCYVLGRQQAAEIAQLPRALSAA